MDKTLQSEGQALHARSSQGELLMPLEQERLDACYAMVEAALLDPAFERMDREQAVMQERLRELSALAAREEQHLRRLRELQAERRALNSERKRLLAA